MQNEEKAPRVAIITGGSRGIGRACAVRLASEGYDVAINFVANEDEAKQAAEAVNAAGGRSLTVQGDVADEAAMSAAFEQVESEFGGVDAVVHCAGRMPLSPIAELDLDEFDGLHRTNVRGTFVVNQQAARRLRDGGSIVNFSSSVVGAAFPTYGAYAASKGAVEALTLILARELRGRDVTVNAVAPGPTATELFLDGKSEEEVQKLATAVPLERLGQPDDIAEAVAFLVGPQGHWVNGQVVRVNGGLV